MVLRSMVCACRVDGVVKIKINRTNQPTKKLLFVFTHSLLSHRMAMRVMMLLMLVATMTVASYPCEEAPYSAYAYCNTNLTPVERAIHAAIVAVETIGADVRLTAAQDLLATAFNKVADYVDEQLARKKGA